MHFVRRRTMNRAVVATLAISAVCRAATLHVPANYPTIQACINAATSGVDECVVAPGTYHETINFLGKAITLRSSGGAVVTTIDATGIGGSVVTCASGEGPDTVLDGFMITGGTGTDVYGGGYTHGGGMYNNGSNTTVTNCTFSGNTANTGGGMYNGSSRTTVTNCTFSGNTANTGGGMYNGSSRPTVTNCTFSGNTSRYGGGMSNGPNGHPTVTNCTFSGNTGTVYGGGMSTSQDSYPTVTNCTFSGNMAGAGGGMHNFGHGNPRLTNCILWGDSPDEILDLWEGAPTIGFSDVQGGLPVGAVDGGGNIDSDPMFVRTPDPGPDGTWDGVDDDYGNLRLRGVSPCINAGDPGFVAQPGETDLEGHARVVCGQVDMGAYEFHTCPSDLTGACCDHDSFGECNNAVTLAECSCPRCEWTEEVSCEDVQCLRESIPTVGGWGLAVLSLLLLTGAKVAFGRRAPGAARQVPTR